MENRIERLSIEVDRLYNSNNPNQDKWVFWGYKNHVLVVKDNAEKLARKEKANVDYCIAGALLHDIADVEMKRFNEGHERRNYEIAENLLRISEFSSSETRAIVEEILKTHSCNLMMPETLEGKIV